MLSSYLAMQNAVLTNNMAVLEMMNASDRMMNSSVNGMSNAITFGNSQPLRPSFSALNADELNIKANETKTTVAQKLIDAFSKRLGKDIQRSTPKFAGLDYKA